MADKSRKILIFSTAYLPYIGGAETAIKGITDQITDCEFDLITARMDITLPVRETIGNITVFRVGTGGRFDKLMLPIRGLKKAASLHRDKNYDLAFSLMASQGGLTAARFKKMFPGVPLLVNLQEGRNFQRFNVFKSIIFKRIVRAADRIIAISNHLKEVAINNGALSSRIQIIPNGVDMENFGREFSYGDLSELSDRLDIKPDEKVIITASRLTYKNALDDLIKAMAILTHSMKTEKFKLVIAGDGEDKNKLTNLVDGLGITDSVVFVGSIENHRLPKYLRIADIFIRPSRSEGLGSAFLEAMAAGLPIIGTPVGGIPDFLKDGETGLFCKVGDPQSIAEKVELLVTDQKLQNNLIREGYKLVAKNYDWKKIAGDYRVVFNSLMR